MKLHGYMVMHPRLRGPKVQRFLVDDILILSGWKVRHLQFPIQSDVTIHSIVRMFILLDPHRYLTKYVRALFREASRLTCLPFRRRTLGRL